jgi:hypothetical protein
MKNQKWEILFVVGPILVTLIVVTLLSLAHWLASVQP